MNIKPKVSVIIPSFDGCRGGNVEKLKVDLNSQTLTPYEIQVVIGVSPNGKARNVGVERVKKDTDFFIFIDDDVTLGNDRILENLIKPFCSGTKDGKPVGMTGPSQLIPENSTWWQKMAAEQIPRCIFPVQEELRDSDMVSHMCLCMPSKLFVDLGMENPEIISGTDPDLRYRVRQAGYRVCVVPNSWAYHPMPPTFWKLIKMGFIKGRNSAVVRRTHPDLVLELDAGYKKDFTPKRGIFFRVVRMLVLLLKALLTLKLFFLVYLLVGIVGNLWGGIKKLDDGKQ